MNKIFKRIISTAVSAGMLLQMLPSFASDDGSKLLFNQSFNSTVTNTVPLNVTTAGNAVRTVEYAKEEKALGLELSGATSIAEVKAELSGKFFISFDISTTAKFNGNVALKSASGATLPILRFVDGRLSTHNGRTVYGVRKQMSNVTVEVDADASSYSLYVDGECKKKDYFVSGFNVRTPSAVTFELTSTHNASVLLDNINVGLGKSLKSYPVAPYDSGSVEFVKKEIPITDKVYSMTDFTEGKRISAAYQFKDNILEQYNDEEGNGVCLFRRNGVQDFHLDMNTTNYQSGSLVYQYDIKLKTTDVQLNSTIKSTTANYFSHFRISGGTLTAGNARVQLSTDEWHTLSTVYNILDATYDVYVDYELVAQNLPVNYLYSHDEAMTWRIHVNRTAGEDWFYVDNMSVYGGTKPRENIRMAESNGIEISDSQSCYADDTPQINALASKVSYHTRSGVLYTNGAKTIVEPLNINGTTFVPTEFFEKAFGSKVNVSDNTAQIGELSFAADSADINTAGGKVAMSAKAFASDNKFYVPLTDAVEKGFGKKLVYDDSVISGGMIIISDNKFDMPTGDALQKLNNFALYQRPDAAKITADYNESPLKGVHPRVLADKSDFDRIKSLMNTDETMSVWAKGMINSADGYVKNPTPLIYELRDGVRLWFVSLDLIRNMTALGMAYQLTGDKKYAERAWIDLESVAKFPSWHPEHHIDVGGMAVGFAIGYDWMYDAFTPEQRAILEQGAYNNGFFDYVDGYQGRSSLMSGGITNKANHNQVMNAGGALLGLAFMDVYPKESAYCVAESIRCLEFAIIGYAPEGSWFEGMGYGAMSLEYMSYQLASIKKIFNTVYTLDASEGVDLIPLFYLYMQSTMGCYTYADGGSQSITFDPGVMWLCDHFGDYDSISAMNKLFAFPLSVRGMIWYRPEQLSSDAQLDLDHKYNDQQIVTMRDWWEADKHTVFAGLKGGLPGENHGHMDVGKFEFYANGTRWTRDIGADDYNLPNYFADTDETSPRWSYYRMRAESHSTIIINPGQDGEFDPNVKAMITRYETKPRGAIAVLDMTDSHLGKAKKAERAMMMVDDRRSVVLRDEIDLSESGSKIYWHMITDHITEVSPDGKSVKVIDKNNRNNYIMVDFVASTSFKLSAEPCKPLPTSPNPAGIADDTDKTVIRLELTGSGKVDITAKLTPCTVDGASTVSAHNIPIANWKIPDGEIPKRPVLDTISVNGVEYSASQKLINHIVAYNETQVPDVVATSGEYDVKITKAKSFEEHTVVEVVDKNNASNISIYRIYFNKMQPLPVENLVEREIVKLEPSSEPQAENPAKSVIDRNHGTRWSAEGAQYMIVDLGKVVDFDKVVMSFMNGDARKYILTMSVSEDGISYTPVYNGTSCGTTNDYEVFDIGLQNARYVKIDGNGFTGTDGSSGSWNSWTEIAVAKQG